jgi:radical SAM superfamily enzyme YgiQ (UPF0313 family)
MTANSKIGLVSLCLFENYGVRFLAAALRAQGHEAIEIYLNDYVHRGYAPPTARQLAVLIDILRARRVQLVGVSLRAGAYRRMAAQVTEAVRGAFGLPVLWGGMHVTMAPEECLPHADLLAVGEAEDTIVEVAAGLGNGDLAGIPGVWRRRGDVRNPLRPLRQDLDALPFRDFHSHGDKYWIRGDRARQGDPLAGERVYGTLASRGCLYDCAFCDVNALRRIYNGLGPFYRRRSVGNVLAELDYARRVFPRLRRVRFDDELFPPDKPWLTEFAGAYSSRVGLPFDILSDPRCLDEAAIDLLAEAGMDKVFVGLQAAAAANRRLYGRPASDERAIELARHLRRRNVRAVFQIIVDDPESTVDDKRQLLDLLLALPRPYDLYAFSLNHWPGAERTRHLLQGGAISPREVEGENDKAVRQFLADFAFPRPAVDRFFLALYELANKRLVPPVTVRRLAASSRLAAWPAPLVLAAKAVNLAKLAATAAGMVWRRELSWNGVRRWLRVGASPSV